MFIGREAELRKASKTCMEKRASRCSSSTDGDALERPPCYRISAKASARYSSLPSKRTTRTTRAPSPRHLVVFRGTRRQPHLRLMGKPSRLPRRPSPARRAYRFRLRRIPLRRRGESLAALDTPNRHRPTFKRSNLMLALCGSNEGFMESEVLGYKSPLYGRRTSQIRLKPFDYQDTARLLGGYSPRNMPLTMQYLAARPTTSSQ